MGVPEKDPLAQLSLPPGFRFYPTDEELLVQYLCRKVAGHHFSLPIIAEIDLYKFDPWVLPSKAIFGEKEWYFFSPRDRKYPNGSRPNRVAGSGYWKATGTDKIITTEGRKVGIKKALVFYVGKAPKGTKTNWIMHEYRLLDSSRKTTGTKLDDWVLCRIYKKNSSAQKAAQNGVVSSREYTQYSNGSSSSSSSHLDDVLESLPTIDERCFAMPRVSTMQAQQEEKVSIHQNLGAGGLVDWANPAVLNSVGEFVSGNNQVVQEQTQGMVNYGGCNDLYVPTFCHVESTLPQKMEEEVQSGVRSQNNNNPWFVQNEGCNQSKIENEEAVARCKERKRFMKDAVSSRNAFAAAHSSYATCLKNTGAALGDFAPGEVQNPQLHSNDTNASFPNPQPFEIPLPPPPLPDFSPAPPLQRAISMPEMKINKPDPRPRPEPVGTIVEEEDEEDKELENEGSLRKRRSNNRVNSNKRVSEEEQQPRPPMPPPPVKQPEPRDHVTHHQHSMAQDTQSGAWEYFFPSFENIAGPSLNAAEEDAVSKVHEVERKVFDEKPRVVEEIDDEVVTPVRGVEVPEPEPEPEPVPEPPAVPDEMMETPVGKGVKLKQTPSSVEGKRIVKHSVNLQQIFADLDDNFLKASEAAHDVSKMLEATRLHYHSNFADNKGHIDHSARVMRVITWNRSFKGIPNVDDGKDDFDSDEHETHATILDKLLAWEKKLYDEVKAGELMKFEYQRKVAALNKLKKRGTNSEALEKAKAVVSHLHTRYIVDMQSLDSTVSEINRLRDEQLYPRLVQLVDGMAEMWKLMLEYHEKQSDTVKLLKTLDISQSTKQTSEHHHDRTYQLLLVVQQWHSQFEMLVNHQKGYIKSLNTWLKLNLIPIESSLKEKVSSPPRVRSAPIQGLLHAWNDRLEKLPDELARTAIGNFVAVIETIFHQQEEEIALKRKCEDTRKELSRKTRQFEDWYNKYMQKKIPDEYNPDTAEDSNGPDEAVTERQVAVEQVKKRLEDEEEAYARQCRQVRAKTMGSLTNRMPELFRAMSDFSLECSKMYSELRSISQNLGQSSS